MLYGAPEPQAGVVQARQDLFKKRQRGLEKLPQLKDALQIHRARCYFQAKVWLQANIPIQAVEPPSETGGDQNSKLADRMD